MTHQVFISYANEDKLVADAICAKLEENRIRCWIAPRDISPGDKYASALLNAIDNSEVIVVVFSSKADKSPHVRNEIERAFNKEKIIIPFRIENIDPCDEMQFFIGSRHWLEALTPPLEAHINDLINVLKTGFNKSTVFSETKPNIIEKKFVMAPEKKVYCPKTKRFFSYVTDLIFGSIFALVLYLIFFIVAGAFLGESAFNNLMFISAGKNSRFGDFMVGFWIYGGIILWLIITDIYAKIPFTGKNLFNLTISQSPEKKSLKWLSVRTFVKIFPLLVILIGGVLNYYTNDNSFFITVGIILQILWAIPMFFSSESQAVHDLFAGTTVCKKVL